MIAARRIKASDLSDARILEVLNRHPDESHTHWTGEASTMLRVMDPEYPDAPVKVLMAKLRSMKRRGLIDGCGCGCRGDWRTL